MCGEKSRLGSAIRMGGGQRKRRRSGHDCSEDGRGVSGRGRESEANGILMLASTPIESFVTNTLERPRKILEQTVKFLVVSCLRVLRGERET